MVNAGQANTIVSLMSNAGYLDDADELFYDMAMNDTPENVLAFANSLDELIAEVNTFLPEN